jgi:hypothetical protein
MMSNDVPLLVSPWLFFLLTSTNLSISRSRTTLAKVIFATTSRPRSAMTEPTYHQFRRPPLYSVNLLLFLSYITSISLSFVIPIAPDFFFFVVRLSGPGY